MFQTDPDKFLNEEVEDSILIPEIPEIDSTEEEWRNITVSRWIKINDQIKICLNNIKLFKKTTALHGRDQ